MVESVVEPVVINRTSLAKMYKVIIHNDPVTPGTFVVLVLVQVFHKGLDSAFATMEETHNTGCALVEVVSLERGEFHIEQAVSMARGRKSPLAFTLESA